MNFDTAREQMLGQQIRAWDVLDQRVLDTLRETPRELFVPESERDFAFADVEIPIGHGQCMMNPKVEARLLQSLDPRSFEEALEVGTGSGFLAACLAKLARQVLSVEIFPDLSEGAGRRLTQLDINNVELEVRDASALSLRRRFDVIAVTASVPTLDQRFVEMLNPRGRLFIVTGHVPAMEAHLITKQPDGRCTDQSLFETVLTPMINAERTEPFVL
jgi:protein-L-isoaspartate(D-aspartate) O-methyltransferase